MGFSRKFGPTKISRYTVCQQNTSCTSYSTTHHVREIRPLSLFALSLAV